MRLPVERYLPLAALIFLAGCSAGASRTEVAAALPTSGPGADYPVVLGDPFTIDGVTYTPVDTLNYDEVGHAVLSSDGGEGVTLAHRTLPLPSYVEVTSLETGRTILARAERRGPMTGTGLVALSPGAAEQLGMDLAGRLPVRVRRVNPPEAERAALRQGEQAPLRMDTPMSLVGVLLRKLNPAVPAAHEGSAQPSVATVMAAVDPDPAPLPAPAKAAPAAEQPVPPASDMPKNARVVQVGAFAVKANAEATAAKVGGSLEKSGNLWLVRMGPYVAHADVAEALAKAQGAGYSDARIQRVD